MLFNCYFVLFVLNMPAFLNLDLDNVRKYFKQTCLGPVNAHFTQKPSDHKLNAEANQIFYLIGKKNHEGVSSSNPLDRRSPNLA